MGTRMAPRTRSSSRSSGMASRSTNRRSTAGPAAPANRATIGTDRTQSPHQMQLRQSTVTMRPAASSRAPASSGNPGTAASARAQPARSRPFPVARYSG